MSKRYFCNPFIGKEKSLEVIDRNFYKSQVENIVKQIVSRQKTGRRDLDGGLYVGAGGVAYMLYYLVRRQPGQYLQQLPNPLTDMLTLPKTWITSTLPESSLRPISSPRRLEVPTPWDFCSEDRAFLHWMLPLQNCQARNYHIVRTSTSTADWHRVF